jgi:recombination protein RecT
MSEITTVFQNENQLKAFLAKNHMNQVINFFGDEKQAMKFFSSVMADVQRNQKLLTCTPSSIINAYMTMAQMGFMPSGISGEAYVLPYANSKKQGDAWIKVTEAQFQIGYQGLVTLFYRAGVEKIVAEIVRKNDKTSFVNGEITHEVDMSLSHGERGEAIGAYVTVYYNGMKQTKYMNGKDIIAHAQKYSKSYDPVGKHSPWNPANDAELWMWKKTVLKQHAKLLPKNETINRAIAEDNEDSVIADAKKLVDTTNLKMGSFLPPHGKDEDNQEPNHEEDSIDIGVPASGSDQGEGEQKK